MCEIKLAGKKSQNLVYSARLTGNQFLYNEFKVMTKLTLQGFDKKMIFEKIVDENLFEYRSLKSIGKHLGAVWERVNYLDEYLKEKVVNEPNEIGRIINFYAILKYDTLFLEFMLEVVQENFSTSQNELTNADISNYFSVKAEQSDIVKDFKEATIKRLRLAYVEILLGAGYITKTENKDKYLLTTPLAVYQISEHLRDNGEKQFVKAMLGV